jgi:hypothetical protein
MTKAPSERFCACRKLVDDDAFEAQIAAHMATPLISGELSKLKRDRYWVGVFLRRALMRYLAIVLSRLLEKPGEGSTGVTASISSLLDMAKSEAVLDKRQIQHFTSEFKKIKAAAAKGEYDLVNALRKLRTIQLAHSLVPWNSSTDDVQGNHLIEFAEAIFDFVMNLDKALTEAIGVSLDSREAAKAFRASAGKFWQALSSIE